MDEVKNNRSEGRSRNIQYDAGEKVKQYKVGLNLTSIIRKLQLSNSVYYNPVSYTHLTLPTNREV